MELQQLKYFISAARLQNFTSAAKECFVPQSTISRAVIRLEAELGTKLFDRIGKSVTLNANGKYLLRRAESAINILNSCVSELSLGVVKGKVRLTVLQHHKAISSAIIKFKHMYPAVIFSISNDPENLRSGDSDFFVASSPPNNVLCDSKLLFDDEMVVVTLRSHPLAKYSSIDISQILNDKFITSNRPYLSMLLSEAAKAKGIHNYEPSIVIESDDIYSFFTYLQMELGIGIVPLSSFYDSDTADLSAYSMIRIKEPFCYRHTFLYWRSSRELSPAVSLFRDFLINEYSV